MDSRDYHVPRMMPKEILVLSLVLGAACAFDMPSLHRERRQQSEDDMRNLANELQQRHLQSSGGVDWTEKYGPDIYFDTVRFFRELQSCGSAEEMVEALVSYELQRPDAEWWYENIMSRFVCDFFGNNLPMGAFINQIRETHIRLTGVDWAEKYGPDIYSDAVEFLMNVGCGSVQELLRALYRYNFERADAEWWYENVLSPLADCESYPAGAGAGFADDLRVMHVDETGVDWTEMYGADVYYDIAEYMGELPASACGSVEEMVQALSRYDFQRADAEWWYEFIMPKFCSKGEVKDQILAFADELREWHVQTTGVDWTEKYGPDIYYDIVLFMLLLEDESCGSPEEMVQDLSRYNFELADAELLYKEVMPEVGCSGVQEDLDRANRIREMHVQATGLDWAEKYTPDIYYDAIRLLDEWQSCGSPEEMVQALSRYSFERADAEWWYEYVIPQLDEGCGGGGGHGGGGGECSPERLHAVVDDAIETVVVPIIKSAVKKQKKSLRRMIRKTIQKTMGSQKWR